MKGIILAAGRGSRLGHKTDNKPKCLTQIANKPLLKWQIEALNEANIKDIFVVRGYSKESINFQNLKFIDNDRWDKTNMVFSLLCADKILSKETCIISYSDIVYHPSILSKLKNINADIAITYDLSWLSLWKLRFEKPLLDAETFEIEDNKVKNIGRRTEDYKKIQGQYMGLIKMSPNGWKKVKEQLDRLSQESIDKLDMTALLQRLIEKSIDISAVPIRGKWCEVDYLSDLIIYEEKLKAEWSHDWR